MWWLIGRNTLFYGVACVRNCLFSMSRVEVGGGWLAGGSVDTPAATATATAAAATIAGTTSYHLVAFTVENSKVQEADRREQYISDYDIPGTIFTNGRLISLVHSLGWLKCIYLLGGGPCGWGGGGDLDMGGTTGMNFSELWDINYYNCCN